MRTLIGAFIIAGNLMDLQVIEAAQKAGRIIDLLPGTANSDHSVPVGWPQRRMDALLQEKALPEAFKQLKREWCEKIGLFA